MYVLQFESELISIESLDKQGYKVKITNNTMTILIDDKECAIGNGISHMYISNMNTIVFMFGM